LGTGSGTGAPVIFHLSKNRSIEIIDRGLPIMTGSDSVAGSAATEVINQTATRSVAKARLSSL
jgi:hypothetical protein